jgi:hypothetical protein
VQGGADHKMLWLGELRVPRNGGAGRAVWSLESIENTS